MKLKAKIYDLTPLSPGVNHDELVGLAERCFSGLPTTYDLPSLEPCRFSGSMMTVRDDTMPFAHLAFAVEVSRLYLTLPHHLLTPLLSLPPFLFFPFLLLYSPSSPIQNESSPIFSTQGCGWSNPDYIPLMIAGAVSHHYVHTDTGRWTLFSWFSLFDDYFHGRYFVPPPTLGSISKSCCRCIVSDT